MPGLLRFGGGDDPEGPDTSYSEGGSSNKNINNRSSSPMLPGEFLENKVSGGAAFTDLRRQGIMACYVRLSARGTSEEVHQTLSKRQD